jgi:putative ABC transport system permease protein
MTGLNVRNHIEDFFKDLTHSLRMFRQNAAFTASAIAALALGIGASSAIFSLVNAVLLKPLHVRESDRVVRVLLTYQGRATSAESPQIVSFWRQHGEVLRDVAASRLELMNLTGAVDPQQVTVGRVNAEFFHLFDAPVFLGRTFTAEEDLPKSGHVAALSHALWLRSFGADAHVLGKSILLAGTSYIVVGVLGPTFDTQQFDQPPEVWIPFQLDPESTDGGCYCQVTARLRPRVGIPAAQAQLAVVAEQFRSAFPKLLGPKTSFTVEPLQEALVGEVRPSLMILMGAVVLVLLIACANVANLMLARAIGRTREIAVRAAVGAGRNRLIRQVLTESVMLSVGGGVLGLLFGFFFIRAMLAIYSGNIPFFVGPNAGSLPRIGVNGSEVTMDWRVLGFTALVSILTGVVFGLIPALQASRADLTMTLKEGSGRSGSGFRQSKIRSLLVMCEIALALILLIGASLLLRTFIALNSVDPGFDSHNVLVMQMSLSGERFTKTSEISELVREGVRHIHSLPQVEAAASSCCIPLETVWQLSFIVVGRPLTGPFHGFAGWTFVSPEYFDAFRIPLLRGRVFTDRDGPGAPGVVVINEAMARRVWPNSDPLNDRLIIGRGVRPEYDADSPRQIIGIVGDIRDTRLDFPARPAMYVPIAQLPDGINALNLRLLPVAWIVRTRVDPYSLATSIERKIRDGTALPVARVRSMQEVVGQSAARAQLNLVLMGAFGGAALLLASIGIYGLMAYSVQQRRQEIGIRLALGADNQKIRIMLLWEGLRLALVGVLVGTVLAFALARLLASFLFGVKPHDPLVFVTVPFLLTFVALLAVWIPAQRSTRINPAVALRYE